MIISSSYISFNEPTNQEGNLSTMPELFPNQTTYLSAMQDGKS